MRVRAPRTPFLFMVLVAILLPLTVSPVSAAGSPGGSRPAATRVPAAFPMPPEWPSICDSIGRKGTRLIRGTNCRFLKLDGVFRRWIVDVPRSAAFPMDRRWPVVMVIHGSSSSGEIFRAKGNWPAVGERVGAITVYPTAWRYVRRLNNLQVTRWNAYSLPDEIYLDRRLDGYPKGSPYPARDIVFLRQVMKDLDGQLRLDRRHIHAGGSSQGGRFIPRMAVEMADTFASVSCYGWCDAPLPSVTPPRRVSVLYGIGADDDLVIRYLAEQRAGLGEIPTSWPQAWKVLKPILRGHLRAWDLPRDPAAIAETSKGVTAQWRVVNTGPRWITRFKVMVFEGLDHVFPSPSSNPRGIDFAALSWEFFQDNPMPPS